MTRSQKTTAVIASVITAVFIGWRLIRPTPSVSSDAAPTVLSSERSNADAGVTMDDLLNLARTTRQQMIQNVDDYSARFVQQERDTSGVLLPESIIQLKVQTRHRGGELGSPMRVYLNFVQPEDKNGREVIWAEDLHDGKLLVHEAGFLGLVPIPPLDPNGMLAMQGQKHPISEIGITRLVEKLIERGEADRNNPNVTVAIEEHVPLGELDTTLIQVKRLQPTGEEEDFSLAEIVIDPNRQIILRYRSFGWPGAEETSPPLLESYTYEDIQLNVGLTDEDFDPENEAYNYP